MIEHPYKLRKENYEKFKQTLENESNSDYLPWSICWDKLKQMYVEDIVNHGSSNKDSSTDKQSDSD